MNTRFLSICNATVHVVMCCACCAADSTPNAVETPARIPSWKTVSGRLLGNIEHRTKVVDLGALPDEMKRDPVVSLIMARRHLQQRKDAAARKAIRELARRYPRSPEPRFLVALRLSMGTEPDRESWCLSTLLRTHPFFAPSYLQLARLSTPSVAMELCAKGVLLSEDNGELKTGMRAALQKALAAASEAKSPWHKLATRATASDPTVEELDALPPALKRDPVVRFARLRLAYDKMDTDKALVEIERLKKLYPNSPAIALLRAKILGKRDKQRQSELLADIIARDPWHARAYYELLKLKPATLDRELLAKGLLLAEGQKGLSEKLRLLAQEQGASVK